MTVLLGLENGYTGHFFRHARGDLLACLLSNFVTNLTNKLAAFSEALNIGFRPVRLFRQRDAVEGDKFHYCVRGRVGSGRLKGRLVYWQQQFSHCWLQGFVAIVLDTLDTEFLHFPTQMSSSADIFDEYWDGFPKLSRRRRH